EERYRDAVWPRGRTRRSRHDAAGMKKRALYRRERKRLHGETVFLPVRYGDDFIILGGAPQGPGQHEQARVAAEQEKTALATYLKDTLGLELSEAKTLVTPVTK